MEDLIIFSNADEHPAARLLKPGFRHVSAVRCEADGYWTQYDWSPTRLHTAPVGGVLADLVAFYSEKGAEVIIRSASRRKWCNWPLMLNNCVGHTKAVLGIPSRAVTPHQLFRYLKKEIRS
jgi:hypothetical protein